MTVIPAAMPLQILEREVGYIFPLMEVEPTICIELKNEEDEG